MDETVEHTIQQIERNISITSNNLRETTSIKVFKRNKSMFVVIYFILCTASEISCINTEGLNEILVTVDDGTITATGVVDSKTSTHQTTS